MVDRVLVRRRTQVFVETHGRPRLCLTHPVKVHPDGIAAAPHPKRAARRRERGRKTRKKGSARRLRSVSTTTPKGPAAKTAGARRESRPRTLVRGRIPIPKTAARSRSARFRKTSRIPREGADRGLTWRLPSLLPSDAEPRRHDRSKTLSRSRSRSSGVSQSPTPVPAAGRAINNK